MLHTCCEGWGRFWRGCGQGLEECLIVEGAAGPGHRALLLTGQSLWVKHEARAAALLPGVTNDAEVELGAVCQQINNQVSRLV